MESKTVQHQTFGDMFEQAVVAGDILNAGTSQQPVVDLESFTMIQLLKLREQIERRLPPRDMGEMDMQGELMMQYQLAKALQNAVLESAGTPANQKAQVMNTCTAVLEQVTKLKIAAFNAERVKAMEIALERAFKGVASELKNDFYTQYTKALEELGVMKKDKKPL